MITTLTPYLNFDGNCKEAMEFYQSVFGGKLDISTFGKFQMDVPDDYKDKVMHAVLEADHIQLMASEGKPGEPTVFGDSVSLSLSGDDEETLSNYFNALADGGKITMPLEKQVWGDRFGMTTDKFGINWMVNIAAPKA